MLAAVACFMIGWIVLGIAAIRLDRADGRGQPGMNRFAAAPPASSVAPSSCPRS